MYVPDSSSEEPIPNGTAFFVVVPSEQDPGKGNVYLVTAKHGLTADNTKKIYNHVYLRLNKKDRGIEFGKINLVGTGPAQNVFTHDDPTVDLAVATVLPDPNKYELKWLSEQLILSRECFKSRPLIEGTEVFFIGLFTPHIGKERNYPVARFGKVALVGVRGTPYSLAPNPYNLAALSCWAVDYGTLQAATVALEVHEVQLRYHRGPFTEGRSLWNSPRRYGSTILAWRRRLCVIRTPLRALVAR